MDPTYFILVILIIIILIILATKFSNNDVTYVTSDVDKELYLVRDVSNKQEASNILARIKQNIMHLTNYVYNNKSKYKDNEEAIDQLHSKIANCIILESSENSVYTSYSVNKGEQIVFCLRSKNNKGQFHDINLLMYVVLHEMSHVGCKEYGHTALFKKIFAFLTQVAIELTLYTKIDFHTIPTEYCGIMITDSII
jgi:hypothetical protein